MPADILSDYESKITSTNVTQDEKARPLHVEEIKELEIYMGYMEYTIVANNRCIRKRPLHSNVE